MSLIFAFISWFGLSSATIFVYIFLQVYDDRSCCNTTTVIILVFVAIADVLGIVIYKFFAICTSSLSSSHDQQRVTFQISDNVDKLNSDKYNCYLFTADCCYIRYLVCCFCYCCWSCNFCAPSTKHEPIHSNSVDNRERYDHKRDYVNPRTARNNNSKDHLFAYSCLKFDIRNMMLYQWYIFSILMTLATIAWTGTLTQNGFTIVFVSVGAVINRIVTLYLLINLLYAYQNKHSNVDTNINGISINLFSYNFFIFMSKLAEPLLWMAVFGEVVTFTDSNIGYMCLSLLFIFWRFYDMWIIPAKLNAIELNQFVKLHEYYSNVSNANHDQSLVLLKLHHRNHYCHNYNKNDNCNNLNHTHMISNNHDAADDAESFFVTSMGSEISIPLSVLSSTQQQAIREQHAQTQNMKKQSRSDTEKNDNTHHNSAYLNSYSKLKRKIVKRKYKQHNYLTKLVATLNVLFTMVVTLVLIVIAATSEQSCYEHKHGHQTSMRSTCSVKIVALVNGVLVLIALYLGFACTKCCYKGDKNDYCAMSVSDTYFRFTMVLKFGYFCLKPYLIYQLSESDDILLVDISNIAVQCLLFLTTTAMAYVTFNKKYKLLSLINVQIIHNSSLLAKTYIISYIIANITTYSIIIFVFVISCPFVSYDMDRYDWMNIVYPQCSWLLLIKLYHNEISQICGLLEQVIVNSKQMNIMAKYGSNINIDENQEELKAKRNRLNDNIGQIVRFSSSLIMWQMSVWIMAICIAVVYAYFVYQAMYGNMDNVATLFMFWYQLIMCLLIAIVMSVAMFAVII